MKKTEEKKILRIKYGEYLMAMAENGVVTTANPTLAMDIGGWSLEQLGYIMSNLKRIGYEKATVETILVPKETVVKESEMNIRKALNSTELQEVRQLVKEERSKDKK